MRRYGEIENVGIEKRLAKKDKQRKTYYKYYTDQQWGNYRNYDVALDSSSPDVDKWESVPAGYSWHTVKLYFTYSAGQWKLEAPTY